MKIHTALMALAAAFMTTAAMASGDHAGGHAHGQAPIGVTGKTADVSRTIEVQMFDTMRFSPDTLVVKQGETIRFVVKNAGQIKHEFVLGTKKDLAAHDAMMKQFPTMEHVDANMLGIAPGQTGELVWKFTTAGVVNVGCMQPGHFDAGMKAQIKVVAAK
jgi:uncharacterized cupredoxin-like copper-binding protein